MTWLLSFLGLPQVLTSALNFLTATVGPAFSKVLDLLSWLLSTLWEGFKDIMDNAATVFTVALLVVASWAYGKVPAEVKAAKCEAKVITQKVYIKKQCTPIKPSAPVTEEFKWPWDFGG